MDNQFVNHTRDNIVQYMHKQLVDKSKSVERVVITNKLYNDSFHRYEQYLLSSKNVDDKFRLEMLELFFDKRYCEYDVSSDKNHGHYQFVCNSVTKLQTNLINRGNGHLFEESNISGYYNAMNNEHSTYFLNREQFEEEQSRKRHNINKLRENIRDGVKSKNKDRYRVKLGENLGEETRVSFVKEQSKNDARRRADDRKRKTPDN